MSDSIMQQFAKLAIALSPENLSCDGECSRREIQIEYNAIMKKWRKLESQIGYKVTEDNAWEWMIGNRYLIS